MRHMIIRLVISLVWLAAAIVCALSANVQMALLYVVLCAVFAYSAWKSRKADKVQGGK